MKHSALFVLFNFMLIVLLTGAKKASPENKPQWAKKDIRDYTDADLERLLDQWEVRQSYV